MQFLTKYEGPWTADEAAHFGRRAGFGARPDEVDHFVDIGMERAVNERVDYPDEDAELDAEIEALPEDDYDRREIKQRLGPHMIMFWLAYRMVNTRHPLREQLTLFFHDHFATEWGKIDSTAHSNIDAGNDGSRSDQSCGPNDIADGYGAALAPDRSARFKKVSRMVVDHNNLLRENGHKNFRDLLIKVSRSPAMLFYLDNHLNQLVRPQENYARELMELFSMGEGNYSEKDVREIARALTGETVDRLCRHNYPYTYLFSRGMHDSGDKEILGHKLSGSRETELERVVDLIVDHVSGHTDISPAHGRKPAASLYMSWKLITWFVHESIRIDHPAVEELADIFYSSNHRYNVREALRVLFNSRLFYDPAWRYRMVKHPADFTTMALRNLELDTWSYNGVGGAMTNAGMFLTAPPNVAGWNHGKAWINTTNLIGRYNFGHHIAMVLGQLNVDNLIGQTEITGRSDHKGMIEFFRKRLLQTELRPGEMEILSDFLDNLDHYIDHHHKVWGLGHLFLTMPRYQLK